MTTDHLKKAMQLLIEAQLEIHKAALLAGETETTNIPRTNSITYVIEIAKSKLAHAIEKYTEQTK